MEKTMATIVGGTLKSLCEQPGCKVSTIRKAIDTQVEQLFVRGLQLDVFTMEHEHE
jgi:hypothetical protein